MDQFSLSYKILKQSMNILNGSFTSSDEDESDSHADMPPFVDIESDSDTISPQSTPSHSGIVTNNK